jgi:hypothetical protein
MSYPFPMHADRFQCQFRHWKVIFMVFMKIPPVWTFPLVPSCLNDVLHIPRAPAARRLLFRRVPTRFRPFPAPHISIWCVLLPYPLQHRKRCKPTRFHAILRVFYHVVHLYRFALRNRSFPRPVSTQIRQSRLQMHPMHPQCCRLPQNGSTLSGTWRTTRENT